MIDFQSIQTEEEAVNEQKRLRQHVITEDDLPDPIKTIAGVDVAYEKEGDRVVAAISVLNADTLEIIETAVATETVSFPYIPGLFSFRELPPVLSAFKKLYIKPDLLVCDGQGFAHPRRFGLACHLGIILDIPTIGCAKKRLHGEFEMPGDKRGDVSPLSDGEDIIGHALRTQDEIKPVFVSIGHKVSLKTATDIVLKLCPKYRLPETTRTADHAVNMAMKQLQEY